MSNKLIKIYIFYFQKTVDTVGFGRGGGGGGEGGGEGGGGEGSQASEETKAIFLEKVFMC